MAFYQNIRSVYVVSLVMQLRLLCMLYMQINQDENKIYLSIPLLVKVTFNVFVSSVLLCRGKAVEDFSGPDCRFLSFKKSDTVYVYYKLSGRRADMWAGSVSHT